MFLLELLCWPYNLHFYAVFLYTPLPQGFKTWSYKCYTLRSKTLNEQKKRSSRNSFRAPQALKHTSIMTQPVKHIMTLYRNSRTRQPWSFWVASRTWGSNLNACFTVFCFLNKYLCRKIIFEKKNWGKTLEKYSDRDLWKKRREEITNNHESYLKFTKPM